MYNYTVFLSLTFGFLNTCCLSISFIRLHKNILDNSKNLLAQALDLVQGSKRKTSSY